METTMDSLIKETNPDPNIQFYIDYCVMTLGTLLISVFCIVTNTLNLVTFSHLGFKSILNLHLFLLSTSDFLMAVCSFSYCWCRVWRLFPQDSSVVSYTIPQKIFNYSRTALSDISSALSLYIAIERCLCVTFPFTFKKSFSKKQSTIILISIAIFFFINEAFLFASLCVERVFDPEFNITRYTTCNTKFQEDVLTSNDIILGIILSTTCQIVISLCGFLMYRALRISSLVRGKWKLQEKNHVSMLSIKEKKLVKMILILAIIYIPTSMPTFLYAWVRRFKPEIFTWLTEGVLNLYTLNSLIFFFGNIHGTVNFFIYYVFNPGFRQTFLQVCRRVKHTLD